MRWIPHTVRCTARSVSRASSTCSSSPTARTIGVHDRRAGAVRRVLVNKQTLPNLQIYGLAVLTPEHTLSLRGFFSRINLSLVCNFQRGY